MPVVEKPAGSGGTYTYTLTAAPAAPPVRTIFSDAARTVVAATAAAMTATASTVAFTGTYPLTLGAARYYLRHTYTTVGGAAMVDDNQELVLTVPSGSVNAVPSWAPTPTEVHGLIPTRPAFTTTSKPSLSDVQGIIDRAALSLAVEFTALTSPLFPVAKAHITYRAAAEVEWGYDPEQQFGGENSQAAHLDQMAGAELTRLRSLYADAGSGGVTRGFTIRPTPVPYIVDTGR